MKHPNYRQGLLLIACGMFLASACNNGKERVKEESAKDSTVAKPVAETKRGPIINITDTLSIRRIVLTIKDSSATMPGIAAKLRQILGVKLPAIIQKNNLKVTGAPIAWYKSEKAPYFFEAGLPVDKKPSKPGRGVQFKEIGIDSVVVAHFYGPYDLLPQAHEALKDWIKDHKKTARGTPYEIYVDDPIDKNGRPKDPYKVQTDVVFPWK